MLIDPFLRRNAKSNIGMTIFFNFYQFHSSPHHQLIVDLPDSIPGEKIFSFTGLVHISEWVVSHAKNERFLKRGIITVEPKNA